VLTFFLQVRDLFVHGRVHLFIAFTLFVWLLWAIRAGLSVSYRPWTEPVNLTASVVVPVVDEPASLFREVLARINRQQPHEVIVVINGPRNEALERVCNEAGVDWVHTPKAGKRPAVRIGVERSTGEITVLVDSDTLWTDDTLSELLKPFADPRVGGVSTRQRILAPDRSLLTHWADWMEAIRGAYAMPAMSRLGMVGCLPGRTIAFRRKILAPRMDDFSNQLFLGVFLEISDDRTLTNYALMDGWRTVYQSTSLVYTDTPTSIRKMLRQQYRWSRGSQYNTLRMSGWMARRARALFFLFWADVLVPFLLAGVIFGWIWRIATNSGSDIYKPFLDTVGHGPLSIALLVVVVVASTMLSMAVRQRRFFDDHPQDILRLPIYLVLNLVALLPVRLVGFFRMAKVSGWGTRPSGYRPASREGRWRPNPWAVVPWILGALIIGACAAAGVYGNA
jgi:hyaluronan synthase